MRRTPLVLGVLFLAAAACSSGVETWPVPAGRPGAEAVTERLEEAAPPMPIGGSDIRSYVGTAVTAVSYHDVCGRYIGAAEVSWEALVVVGPPLAADGATEANAVHLSLGPPLGVSPGEGMLSLSSAGSLATSSGALLLEYWRLELDGETLTGELVDTHEQEAAAANLLHSQMELVQCQPQFGTTPWTWPIAEGATLEGRLADDTLELTITGNVTMGRLRPFTFSVTADRVELMT